MHSNICTQLLPTNTAPWLDDRWKSCSCFCKSKHFCTDILTDFFFFEGLQPCCLVDQWHVARRQIYLKKFTIMSQKGATRMLKKAIFKKYKCIFNKHVYTHGLELNSTTQLKTSIIQHLLCKLSIRNETFTCDKMWWHLDSKIYV